MKKTLLTVLGLASIGTAFAQQVPSPSWSITQNTSFTVGNAGVRFLDAVDQNTVWLTGYDGLAPNRNYNWWSKTTNGGTSYTTGNCYADTNTYVMANLEGINGDVAWVSSYLKSTQDRGGVHKTTDGGATWNNMLAPNMYTVAGGSFINVVSFLTPSVGMIMGDPIAGEFEIYRTTNGGTSWTVVPGANIPNPLSGEYGLVNIYCKQGTTNWWFGTNKNRVFRSTDAGVTWSVSAQMTSTLGAVLGVNDVAFTDPMNGVADVYFGPQGGGILTLWKTTDGGATWTMIPSVDPNYGKNDIAPIWGTSWYASAGAGQGNNIISYSSDQGVTWNSWGGSNIQYLRVDFVSPTVGWAGSFSTPTAGIGGIYKYTGPNMLQPANANFTVSASTCTGVATFVNNQSTGNPFPTFQWSVNPAATISNSTATNPSITFTTAGVYTITLAATNQSNTSTTTRTVSVSNCVGVNELMLSSENIGLYPVPASTQLFVELPGVSNYSYQMSDLLGKNILVGTISADNKATIDVSNLKKGVYFLSVQSDGQTATRKVIIE